MSKEEWLKIVFNGSIHFLNWNLGHKNPISDTSLLWRWTFFIKKHSRIASQCSKNSKKNAIWDSGQTSFSGGKNENEFENYRLRIHFFFQNFYIFRVTVYARQTEKLILLTSYYQFRNKRVFKITPEHVCFYKYWYAWKEPISKPTMLKNSSTKTHSRPKYWWNQILLLSQFHEIFCHTL